MMMIFACIMTDLFFLFANGLELGLVVLALSYNKALFCGRHLIKVLFTAQVEFSHQLLLLHISVEA